MINGLHKIREELHKRILVSRSIEAMILHPRFERLWSYSEKLQKDKVSKCIEVGDKNGVLKWIREHPSIDIGEKPLRDLYPIAQKLRIKNYSRLQRDDLIIAIKEEEFDAQQRIYVDTDSKKNHPDVDSLGFLKSKGGISINPKECS